MKLSKELLTKVKKKNTLFSFLLFVALKALLD